MPLRLALSAVLLLLLGLIAFWPQYLSKLVLLEPYTHAYTFLGLLWLLGLIAQPLRFAHGCWVRTACSDVRRSPWVLAYTMTTAWPSRNNSFPTPNPAAALAMLN